LKSIMTKSVKVALAGISGYGQSYVDALLANKAGADFEFVACVDPYPQRCRSIETLRSMNLPIYPTMLGLFGAHPDLDLVMLSTPIHLHASQICDSIRAGVNVLCEKPLAGSVRDAQRVLRVDAGARQRGQFIGIGYQWSFSRAVLSLKQDILEGKLGRCLRMRTRVDFPREQAYFRRNSWAGRMHAAGGEDVFDSPVNNATAHYLHNMLFLLGDQTDAAAIPLSVQAELYRANDIENFDTAAMRCEMPGGTELLFYTTHTVPSRCGPMFSFEFEHGTVTYEHREGEIKAIFRNGSTQNYGSPEKDRDRKIWMAMDSVKTHAALSCTPRTAFAHTLCAAAALESSATITRVPAEALRSVPGETTPMTIVDGLGEALGECFESGTLPSEAGRLSWAKPGRVITVESGAISAADDVAMIA
jgi:predicted dehydrogenase